MCGVHGGENPFRGAGATPEFTLDAIFLFVLELFNGTIVFYMGFMILQRFTFGRCGPATYIVPSYGMTLLESGILVQGDDFVLYGVLVAVQLLWQVCNVMPTTSYRFSATMTKRLKYCVLPRSIVVGCEYSNYFITWREILRHLATSRASVVFLRNLTIGLGALRATTPFAFFSTMA